MNIRDRAAVTLNAKRTNYPRYMVLLEVLMVRTGLSRDNCEMLIMALAVGLPV